jgi:hypothetical protein
LWICKRKIAYNIFDTIITSTGFVGERNSMKTIFLFLVILMFLIIPVTIKIFKSTHNWFNKKPVSTIFMVLFFIIDISILFLILGKALDPNTIGADRIKYYLFAIFVSGATLGIPYIFNSQLCPFCKKRIKKDANKCSYCGKDL